MSAAPKVAAIRGGHLTLATAADAFLAIPRTASPNTHRTYASAIDRTIALLGRDRPLAEIGAALAELWGMSAPATWNRNRAAVTSWLVWCQTKKHWAAPSVPAEAERRKESADETRAVAKTTLHRLLSRRDIPLRERALWRMLYETAARAAEILALNVEDLDLEHRPGAPPPYPLINRVAASRNHRSSGPSTWANTTRVYLVTASLTTGRSPPRLTCSTTCHPTARGVSCSPDSSPKASTTPSSSPTRPRQPHLAGDLLQDRARTRPRNLRRRHQSVPRVDNLSHSGLPAETSQMAVGGANPTDRPTSGFSKPREHRADRREAGVVEMFRKAVFRCRSRHAPGWHASTDRTALLMLAPEVIQATPRGIGSSQRRPLTSSQR
ncbi:tyrosine recombinase XerC [Streptosporangium roseum]|uniref:hypothetical protein n=1 Tax=Streptosporangium roseum TaxID=2001 RepID=UPI0030A5E754